MKKRALRSKQQAPEAPLWRLTSRWVMMTLSLTTRWGTGCEWWRSRWGGRQTPQWRRTSAAVESQRFWESQRGRRRSKKWEGKNENGLFGVFFFFFFLEFVLLAAILSSCFLPCFFLLLACLVACFFLSSLASCLLFSFCLLYFPFSFAHWYLHNSLLLLLSYLYVRKDFMRAKIIRATSIPRTMVDKPSRVRMMSAAIVLTSVRTTKNSRKRRKRKGNVKGRSLLYFFPFPSSLLLCFSSPQPLLLWFSPLPFSSASSLLLLVPARAASVAPATAIPTSARFNAGASFTPSPEIGKKIRMVSILLLFLLLRLLCFLPVMPHLYPSWRNVSTMRNLCSGNTCAKPSAFLMNRP